MKKEYINIFIVVKQRPFTRKEWRKERGTSNSIYEILFASSSKLLCNLISWFLGDTFVLEECQLEKNIPVDDDTFFFDYLKAYNYAKNNIG